jgi:GNAT superfamily N-acetyltransferase
VELEIRPATVADLPGLERRCWAEGEEEMHRRIRENGTCSIIGLDGGRPVAQLYLRAYQRGFRAARGAYEGAWWADLLGVEDRAELPAGTAMLGCWHVGRVREEDGEEREAEEYRGQGVGIALLRQAIEWVRSGSAPFEALAAKAADTEARAYLNWLGGLALPAFAELGFEPLATFEDPYIEELAEPPEVWSTAAHPARFHLVLLRCGSAAAAR